MEALCKRTGRQHVWLGCPAWQAIHSVQIVTQPGVPQGLHSRSPQNLCLQQKHLLGGETLRHRHKAERVGVLCTMTLTGRTN